MGRWLVLVGAGLLGGLPAQVTATLHGTPPAELAFGEPFALQLVREWPADHAGRVLDDSLFEPLVVAQVVVHIEALAGGRVREVRDYTLRPTAVGELPARPLDVGARAPDGRAVPAVVTLPALQVRTGLPEPPGDLAWDLDVRPERSGGGWLGWLVGPGLLLGGLAWASWSRRRPTADVDPAVAGWPAAPAFDAAAALRELPAPGAEPAAIAAFTAQVKALVRQHLAQRFGVPAAVRTSEELQALLPAAPGLAACFRGLDRVLFAAAATDPAGCAALRTTALDCVLATAAPPAAGAGG